ncbi:MAG: hypothetical protein Q4D14_00960 [Bacteroidales bacterium]|nr:hypothetical protein [Bacteroidales bacterium]
MKKIILIVSILCLFGFSNTMLAQQNTDVSFAENVLQQHKKEFKKTLRGRHSAYNFEWNVDMMKKDFILILQEYDKNNRLIRELCYNKPEKGFTVLMPATPSAVKLKVRMYYKVEQKDKITWVGSWYVNSLKLIKNNKGKKEVSKLTIDKPYFFEMEPK